MKYRKAIIFLLIGLSILSCRHRLKPKMYQIIDGQQMLMTSNDSYFHKNLHLLLDSAKVIPGDYTVLITSHTLVDTGRTYIAGNVISFDDKYTYRLFVELPSELRTDSLNIADKSVGRLTGQYDLSNEQRTYICREGFILIDSVKNTGFHAVLSGLYVNPDHDTLQFRGNLKARLR
ncbi:MAG: hypothetical protein JW763_09410 [candidate division Zixibacteria bacterium]|nr:hypothetical protein [candidate division Zixibacteria bacterium]